MQKKSAGSDPPKNESETPRNRRFLAHSRSRAAIGAAIFLIGFGVRTLTWHDTRLDVGKVQTSVVADYQRIAHLLRTGGVSSFFSPSSPLADLNNLGHPPGYSLLLAIVYSIRQSDTALQFVQIIADSLSVVMIFLIVSELAPLSAGVVTGVLAAFSPQLAWNSVLLLPDSISVMPILLAVFLLARALKRPRLLKFVAVGALIGVSCWLRANAMLLTFFVAIAVAILTMPPKRWQFALAVICGTLLTVLPLTIRNAIVFHRFIPLSLGAGQTFLEGIADYDKEGRFGIPDTDMGIMKQEAEIYQRPDYYGTLFNPDGVERERARLSRGFAVVRSHPFWFAGVMAKRASSMLRLERSRLISNEPAISHAIRLDGLEPVWTHSIGPLTSGNGSSPENPETLTGDDSRYGKQFSSDDIAVVQGMDYVFAFPVKVKRGRVRISVSGESDTVYASTVVEALDDLPSEQQPQIKVELVFVSRKSENVQLVFSNEATSHPVFELWPPRLFQLGPARLLWTQYPRFVVHAVQKIFLSAVMLPLVMIGLVTLIFRRQTFALVVLSVLPIYFFTVQSTVHTEYRYVLAVTYFLFAFAGIAIGCCFDFVVQKLTARVRSSATVSVPSA